mgnify:CR=1 FL=1
MAKDTIGVGLIGSGFMGKAHALAWNAVGPVFGDTPRIRLLHLGEAGDELARKKATEFGFERASGDWRQVIADPDVDVVSITTPNKFHLEMATAALAAAIYAAISLLIAWAMPVVAVMILFYALNFATGIVGGLLYLVQSARGYWQRPANLS